MLVRKHHPIISTEPIRTVAGIETGRGVVCAASPDSVVILNHQTRIICLLVWVQGLVETTSANDFLEYHGKQSRESCESSRCRHPSVDLKK